MNIGVIRRILWNQLIRRNDVSDNYQAVYDAVRSRFANCYPDEAIERSIRDMNLSHYIDQAMEAFKQAGYEQQRWCVLLRPKIYIDGNMWCVLYGDNLQDGIAGFGETPAQAMNDFDSAWNKKLTQEK